MDRYATPPVRHFAPQGKPKSKLTVCNYTKIGAIFVIFLLPLYEPNLVAENSPLCYDLNMNNVPEQVQPAATEHKIQTTPQSPIPVEVKETGDAVDLQNLHDETQKLVGGTTSGPATSVHNLTGEAVTLPSKELPKPEENERANYELQVHLRDKVASNLTPDDTTKPKSGFNILEEAQKIVDSVWGRKNKDVLAQANTIAENAWNQTQPSVLNQANEVAQEAWDKTDASNEAVSATK